MLLAFAKRLRAQIVQQGTTPAGQTIGTLTDITPYDLPRYGDVEGVGLVQLDFTANMTGYSPVERCLDSQGETAWIPTELVRNIRLTPFVQKANQAAARTIATPGAVRSKRRRTAAKPAQATQ
jgi:hypothetical protein